MSNTQVLTLIYEWAEDYPTWAAECVKFRGKDGVTFRHDHPNDGQIKLRAPCQRQRCILKGRQVGASSEIAAFFIHKCLFVPGTVIAVAAQTAKGVKGTNQLYAFVVNHLPSILRTGLFEVQVGIESIKWPKLGSEIQFGTANSESWRGVARQGAHLTECALFDDLEEVLNAIRPTCHGPLVMESTAKGPGHFHQAWNDPHNERVFISWMDDPTAESDAPVPDDLTPQEQAYIDLHQLSDRKASYFVRELRATSWDGWKQEHPSNPEEAFILSGDRFFQVGFFPGDTATIQPLVEHLKPVQGRRYAIGCDPASGSSNLKGDRSACVVLDVTDPQNIRTAASYAARLPPKAFAKDIAKLSKKYLDAVVCVERNAGWGLTVLEALRAEGISLYRTRVFDKTKNTYQDHYGWDTSASTRPLMLAQLQETINSRHYVPNDPRIEEECNAFRYNEDGKPEAIAGAHDDLIFAIALALQAASQARDTTVLPSPAPPPDPGSFESVAQWEMATGELYESNDDYDEED